MENIKINNTKYYEILGVDKYTSFEEIKKAFKRPFHYHPDKCPIKNMSKN